VDTGPDYSEKNVERHTNIMMKVTMADIDYTDYMVVVVVVVVAVVMIAAVALAVAAAVSDVLEYSPVH
jgi:signal transduction histidine kinase